MNTHMPRGTAHESLQLCKVRDIVDVSLMHVRTGLSQAFSVAATINKPGSCTGTHAGQYLEQGPSTLFAPPYLAQ